MITILPGTQKMLIDFKNCFYDHKCLNFSFKLTTDPISNTEVEHDDDDRDLHERHNDPDVDGVAVGKHLHDSHPVATEMFQTVLVNGQRKCHERNFHSGAISIKLKNPEKKKIYLFFYRIRALFDYNYKLYFSC